MTEKEISGFLRNINFLFFISKLIFHLNNTFNFQFVYRNSLKAKQVFSLKLKLTYFTVNKPEK